MANTAIMVAEAVSSAVTPHNLPERILDRRELRAMVPVGDMTIHRWEAAGRFPRRIHLGPNRIGWRLSEVLAWIESRPSERVASEEAPAAA